MNKSNEEIPWWVAFIFILLFIGFIASQQENVPIDRKLAEKTQTWREYSSINSETDLFSQLINSQNLLIALNNDVNLLEAQNVDIQSALFSAQNQLKAIQDEANKQAKIQRREQWLTMLLGAFLGWIISIIKSPNDIFRNYLSPMFNSIFLKRGDKSLGKGYSLLILILFILFLITLGITLWFLIQFILEY